MAYRIGVPQGYAVRDGAVACDEAVRNAGLTMIAGARVATDVGGVRLDAACAVTASPARPGVQGTNAPTTQTTSGMKAAATTKTASGTKATTATETATSATVETDAPATMKAAATATAKTTATAVARLGYVCEREPNACGSQDRSERQRDLFAAP